MNANVNNHLSTWHKPKTLWYSAFTLCASEWVMRNRNFVGKFLSHWMKNFLSVGYTRCKAMSTLNCMNWVTWVLAYVDHTTILYHTAVGYKVTTLPQFSGIKLTKWSSQTGLSLLHCHRNAIVIVNAIHFRHYVGFFSSCFAYFCISIPLSNICSFSFSSFFADNFTHSTCSRLDYKLNRVARIPW